jgi:hypothetical protein
VAGRLLSYEVANVDAPQMAAPGDRVSAAAEGRGFRFGDARIP